MPRKTKTKEIVDGKVDDKETVKVIANINGGKANVRSIDELIGRKPLGYTVGTVEEYEAKIKGLTLADLQKHATDVGLLPVTNRNVLINRLIGEFKKKARGFFNTSQFNTIEPKSRDKALKAARQGAN